MKGGIVMKKPYTPPVIEKFGDLETIILSGRQAHNCKTDCR